MSVVWERRREGHRPDGSDADKREARADRRAGPSHEPHDALVGPAVENHRPETVRQRGQHLREEWPEALAGLRVLAFAILMLARSATLLAQGASVIPVAPGAMSASP